MHLLRPDVDADSAVAVQAWLAIIPNLQDGVAGSGRINAGGDEADLRCLTVLDIYVSFIVAGFRVDEPMIVDSATPGSYVPVALSTMRLYHLQCVAERRQSDSVEP